MEIYEVNVCMSSKKPIIDIAFDTQCECFFCFVCVFYFDIITKAINRARFFYVGHIDRHNDSKSMNDR